MANGLNIPGNLYSGGAVVFDNRPSTNLYIQLIRQKQARDEALDNYERARLDRINEAGLRDQDREGLDNLILDIKGYYNQNKDAIRKGNSAAAFEYEKKFRDALGYISESKERTAKATAMEKYRQERLKQGRQTTDDYWDDYQRHELPIRAEGSVSMPLEKYLSQQAPKFDNVKFVKSFSDIKRTPQGPRYEAIPGDRFNRNKFIDEVYDDTAKETIAARAAEAYDSDDGFAYEVQQDYGNPVKRGMLEKIFAEEYKTSPQSMSDYAVAKAIQQLQPRITGKPVKEENWQAKQDYLQKYKERNIQLNSLLIGLRRKDEESPLNLRDYPMTEDGQVDISQLMEGVAVDKVGNLSMPAETVLYNPETGDFTYYDRLGGQAKRKSFDQFIQDVTTNNPGIDVKFIRRLQTAETRQAQRYKPQPKKETPKRPPLDSFNKKQ